MDNLFAPNEDTVEPGGEQRIRDRKYYQSQLQSMPDAAAFAVNKEIKRARVYMTAHGVYANILGIGG